MKKFSAFAKTFCLLFLTSQIHGMEMEKVQWVESKVFDEIKYITSPKKTPAFDEVALKLNNRNEGHFKIIEVFLKKNKKIIEKIFLETPALYEGREVKELFIKSSKDGSRFTSYRVCGTKEKHNEKGSYNYSTNTFSVGDKIKITSTPSTLALFIKNVIHIGGEVVENDKENE